MIVIMITLFHLLKKNLYLINSKLLSNLLLLGGIKQTAKQTAKQNKTKQNERTRKKNRFVNDLRCFIINIKKKKKKFDEKIDEKWHLYQ